MKQRMADNEARKQARFNILSQNAQSLGAPGYQLEAAKTNYGLANEPTMTDKLLTNYAGQKMKPAAQGDEPDEDDFLKGL
jgi:hypothetical protein